MLNEDAVKKAKQLFSEDYNCAQSVLKATIEARDMKIPSVTYLAAGFGGGMGICGETCGAVSGAVIAIGLLLERIHPERIDHKKKSYEYVREFIRLFREKHHSVKCNDLVGVNISTDEGYQKGHEEKIFETKCPGFVETAVRLVLDMFPPCDAC
ncbi:MAG: C-GCAxxG-C-C family protein [Candidatus Thorarchaeota archaeon]